LLPSKKLKFLAIPKAWGGVTSESSSLFADKNKFRLERLLSLREPELLPEGLGDLELPHGVEDGFFWHFFVIV
jgi:hypothetical protein